MSGYLGIVTGEAASFLSQPAPLIIGSLVLQGHEVPSHITIGGAQAVTIHKLPGGGRIIDAMGADDGSIGWRGLFVGPDAAQRARALDVMRIEGVSQALSFGDYTFNVVVVHCEYDYQERGSIINYRVKTERVSAPSILNSNLPSLDFALQDDLGTSQTLLTTAAAAALTYASLVGKADAASITMSAFNLTTIAAGIGTTAVTAAATTLSTLPQNGAVQAGLQSAGTALQANIEGLSIPTASLPSVGLSLANSSALAATAAQAASLAALVQAGGYVNRARANIASSNAQTITPLIHA